MCWKTSDVKGAVGQLRQLIPSLTSAVHLFTPPYWICFLQLVPSVLRLTGQNARLRSRSTWSSTRLVQVHLSSTDIEYWDLRYLDRVLIKRGYSSLSKSRHSWIFVSDAQKNDCLCRNLRAAPKVSRLL